MKESLEKIIVRVQKMEVYFDTLASVLKSNPQILEEDANLQNMLRELKAYLENGQWLLDYECDERGELPADLKRGVLSQDGLYNLLSDIKNKNFL